MATDNPLVVWLEDVGRGDIGLVGGKNANSGEMISTLKNQGISVPEGFATTAEAYWRFIKENDLDAKIETALQDCKEGCTRLEQTGQDIRRMILNAQFPQDVAVLIKEHYRELSKRYNTDNADVAVRSSATAEDLPTASFAGQQETFLNISGEEPLLDACRRCYASLFTDRAISYRIEKGFAHTKVALSIGVQKMIRSDLAGSGVMFTLDTDTGFPRVVEINAAWGLGECRPGLRKPRRVHGLQAAPQGGGQGPHHREDPGRQGAEARLLRGRHQVHQERDDLPPGALDVRAGR